MYSTSKAVYWLVSFFCVADADTWIFPLVQMGQLNICHDSEVTLKLLQTASAGATLKLATGYFNLTSDYSWAVLKGCRATCHLLTAHPTTNGFFSMSSAYISLLHCSRNPKYLNGVYELESRLLFKIIYFIIRQYISYIFDNSTLN